MYFSNRSRAVEAADVVRTSCAAEASQRREGSSRVGEDAHRGVETASGGCGEAVPVRAGDASMAVAGLTVESAAGC